jgi:outer membrane protein assembly factor BamB
LQVVDWDDDGLNEIIVASDYSVTAMRYVGNYLFDQVWAAPMGKGWALSGDTQVVPGDTVGSENALLQPDTYLWTMAIDGRMHGYLPNSFVPMMENQLILSSGEKIEQAEAAHLMTEEVRMWLTLIRLANGGFELRAFPFAGGAAVWSYPTTQTDPYGSAPVFITAQVDNDPQREIILSTGAVIDPLLSLQQWYSPDGFVSFAAGDIDGDGRDELIHTRSYPFLLRAVDVEIGAEKWSVPLSETSSIFYQPAVLDMDGDGNQEVISGYWPNILKIRNGATGELLWSVFGPAETNAITTGDIDSDGRPDLVWAAGGDSYSGNIYAAPVDRFQPLFSTRDYDGPYSALPLAMRGNFPLELAILAAETRDYMPGTHFVVNSATGALQRDLSLPVRDLDTHTQQDPPIGVLLFNSDADPAWEAVVAPGTAYFDRGEMYALDDDGSLVKQRATDLWVKPVWAGDIDNDSDIEIVCQSRYGVAVFNARTLAIEWQMGAIYTDTVYDVAVGDVDADGVQEILVASERNSLRSFNGINHTLEWQMPLSRRHIAVSVGDADTIPGLEIAVVEDQRLTFYDGATRELKARTVTVSSASVTELALVSMISAPYQQMVLAISGEIALFRHPMDFSPTQVIQLPAPFHDYHQPQLVFADVDNDNHLDMLVGHSSGVDRYRMRQTSIDHLPPQARVATPAAGRTLVSRDVWVEASLTESLDEASVTSANAQLRSAGHALPVDLSYDDTRRTLRLTPRSLLPPSSAVTVWLGPGLRDRAGNGLDGNNNGIGGEPNDATSWQFTTGSTLDQTGPVVRDPALTPNPAWVNMPISLTATVDDGNPGAVSNVLRAEYFVDSVGPSGTGARLLSADGQFDEPQEDVAITVDTTGWSGQRVIYLRAQDSASNWGAVQSITLTLQPHAPANWPTFGQNAARTGHNSNQGVITGYTLAWERDIAALFNASWAQPMHQVAAANDIVIASLDADGPAASSDGIISLDTRTGEERWRRSFPRSLSHSINPATIADGIVYFQQCDFDQSSKLFALNALTGEQIWQSGFPAQWETYLAPAVAAGRVFISNGSGGIHGFSATHGDKLWASAVPSSYGVWTPTTSNGLVYSWRRGILSANHAVSGETLWSASLAFGGSGTVVGHDQTAYVISTDGVSTGKLLAVNLMTRQVKWRANASLHTMPAVADNVVYVLNGTKLTAYETGAGTELWSYDTGGVLQGAPLVTATHVYVTSAADTWVIDRVTHAVVWHVDKSGWLTVANDQLFISQPNGMLAAYNAVD